MRLIAFLEESHMKTALTLLSLLLLAPVLANDADDEARDLKAKEAAAAQAAEKAQLKVKLMKRRIAVAMGPAADAPAPPVDAPAPAADPAGEYPCFDLKDGTRIVGTLAQTSFEVKTAYGILTVPAQDLVRIRFGAVSDPELAGRIQALVKQLGDADFATREAATKALEKLGNQARVALEAVRKSTDAEIQERAGRLLDALEASEEEPALEDDELQTVRFTIRGVLQVATFPVATKFGQLVIEKKYLRSLVLQSFERSIQVLIPGNRESQNPLDTGIRLKRGASFEIRASGNITLNNWGQASGPEGNPQCGNQIQGLPVGCLVGRIGPSGRLFKVGEHYKGVAEKDGTLFLCIGTQNCGQNNTGEYKAQVVARDNP